MVDVRNKLLEATALNDPLRKQMVVAGIICRLFRDCGERAIMVGGSAVEFYTAAQYTTKDIDFIAGSSNCIKVVMAKLGFANRGGTWVLPDDPTIVVEFPIGPLIGSYDKIQMVRLQDGDVAEVIGVEDIIVDRMTAAKFWADGSEVVARYMAAARYDVIDWKYCLKAAAASECRSEVERLRDWSRRQWKIAHKAE